MIERRILTVGIRALGWLFLVRALADLYSVTSFFMVNMTPNHAISILTGVRVLAALVLIRYTARIAARLTESENPVEPTRHADQQWNRWLIASAVVYALVTTLPEAVFRIAQTIAVTSDVNVTGNNRAIGLLSTIAVLLPLLVLAALLARRNPNLLTGKGTYDNR